MIKENNRLLMEPTGLETIALSETAEIINQIVPVVDAAVQQHASTISEAHVFDPVMSDLIKVNAGIAVGHMSSEESAWLPRALLLGACALYGTNFGAVKFLEDTMPVSTLYLLRFSIASLAILPWLFAKKAFKVEAFVGGLEVGLYLFLAFAAQGLGLIETSASKSAFIASLAVVFVPLYDFLSGKKLSSRTVLTSILALSGVAVLELGDLSEVTFSDVLTMFQPLMFGLCFWKMERLLPKHPDGVLSITLSQLLAVATLCGVWAMGEGNFPTLSSVGTLLSNRETLIGLLWVGIVTTTLTFGVETYVMKYLKATEVSLIFTTEPLFGALFASYLLGEKSDWHIWLGGAIIMASCAWGSISENYSTSGAIPPEVQKGPTL